MSILKIKDSQGNWVGVPTVKGDTGNGISSAVLNNDYTLTLTFTDGTTYTTPSIRGDKGDKGDTGAQGIKGDKGDKGDTGATGAKGEQGERGLTGADGISPTVTITPITGGHRITITDADGEHSADVMDGTGSVDDVQINGQSIVSDGVANVPIASTNTFGAIKVLDSNGTLVDNTGALRVATAGSALIKKATGSGSLYQPISPYYQHESVFYGLAKSAGDTTQSASSNAVGTYTDEAKAKIQSMLGFGGFELIKTVELTEDSANIEIDTDEAGNAFKLTELFFIVSAKGSASTSGNNPCYVKNNWWYYCLTISNVVRPTDTMISGYVKNIFVPSLNAEELSVCQVGIGGNTVPGMHWNGKMPQGTEHDYSEYFLLYTIGTAKFGAGTVLMLFGRRK